MSNLKRILLCGSSGMVGRNIKDSTPAKYELLTPQSSELNLLNYGQTIQYLRQEHPGLIIHAAGIVGGIQANIANPVKFLTENTDMGRNLLLAAQNAGVTKLLNLGSSCMYPRQAPNPLKEESILDGELEPTNEGYAIAKIFTQRLCTYINKENPGFSYKTIIPCNLYGKYDDFSPEKSHMIPAVIRKIHETKKRYNNTVEIWGDGKARREFMYAGDLVRMMWEYIDRFDQMPNLMNIGLGYDYTINEYYQTIADVVGFSGSFSHNLSKPVGMKQKLVDTGKQKQVGLNPHYTLKQGIEATYQYFLSTENQ
ncbi:GDP-L-fucose synthase [Salinivirga cyanobacteriivorans]|uniref:GDP-L-fucose synthase n=1 Tax=Salinivirga cyanobacteriivorans TaxID=1307839 RepID=A0A0S2HZZ4_9BACT|nr:NAD-dependent epimerase/dehydratase family protein [Salinivirga cyanobacteriivorans]ALO15601.1 GDP-L-fucose synthase [Salinivirga cyanobacteriivorans]